MTCEELEELAGALALGAAPPGETETARAHLASCPSAHALVRELAAVVALLADAAEPVEPPARLRSRLLAAARADDAPRERANRTPLAIVTPPPDTRNAAPPRRAPEAQPSIVRRRGVWRGTLPGWLAAAAVLVAAAGLGVWNVSLRRDLDARDSRLAQQQQAFDAVARGGKVTVLKLLAPDLGNARGAVLRPSDGPPVMLLEGLKRPDDGKVYQAWAIRGGVAEDLGTFLPEDGLYVLALPDLGGVEAVAVTVEPRRLPQPSGPRVFEAPLTIGVRPASLVQRYVSQ